MKIINALFYTMILYQFFVQPYIRLKKYGTNQCLFKHWLKLK